jgi:hypothetical protein
MIDDEGGAVGGMRIGRGNRSTLCTLQIPRELTWARTRADAVGSLNYDMTPAES